MAQAFTASQFDWRIGVLGGAALFACRYHMARGHWQIVRTGPSGYRRYGKVETFAVEAVPSKLIEIAVRDSGFEIVRRAVTPGAEMTALAGFEQCLALYRASLDRA